MSFTDLFIAAVPDGKRGSYADLCKETQTYFIETLGAVSCADFWGADVPEGELTSLPMAVKAEPGETVAMGWVRWPSKEVRDAGWARMMQEDPGWEMPFDGKRMIFGGFEELTSRSL
ncbi:DUF1428 domain-containing protein [Palleronia caenipelagi]|uniref:DUF1428 domain-containing protein n=1 Tax=Palleronia caenipelagi TaxID=2489174 RepID=A0A547Q9A8_9RHOB|nr:DUF1428 domain-containing protein [Palleronia caenipelagi]TRD22961.1 DUF1428 domain-containing protein [Palleronia caenipelagi]